MAVVETTFEGRILQLAMGFGQGAGVLLATEAALTTARDAYADHMRDIGDNWGTAALQAIEYSRLMGSLSAHHAQANGRCVIDVPDVAYALNVVRLNTLMPLDVCRITEMLFR
jgi:hypothetical protein